MFVLFILFIGILLIIWFACCYWLVPNFSKRVDKILDVLEEKEQKKEGNES